MNPTTIESVNIHPEQESQITEIGEIPLSSDYPNYKQHLVDFYAYLNKNHKRWLVYQIKYTMIQGRTEFRIAPLFRKQWIRYRNISNFWKSTSSMPEEQKKYYHKPTNVLITDKVLRNIIDFARELDLDWYPVESGTREFFAKEYNEIGAYINYSKFR